MLVFVIIFERRKDMLLFEVLEIDYSLSSNSADNNCNGNNHCTLPT